MEVLGKATVEIRASEKFFESDLRKIAKSIKDIKVNVKADVNLTGVNKKLRDFRSRNEKRILMLKADITTDLAEKRIEQIWEKYDGKVVSTNLDVNTVEANGEMEDFWNAYDGGSVNVGVKTDLHEINRARATIDTFTNATKTLRTNVVANADTSLAESQLALLVRRRTALVDVNLSPQAREAMTGALNAMTGTLPADDIRSMVYHVAGGFEGIVSTAGVLSTAVGAISAGVFGLGGSLANIIVDIGKMSGLLAALPAVMTTFKAATYANKTAWDGFSDALVKDPVMAAEAIGKLTESARGSATAFRSMKLAMDAGVQKAYWDEMGASMENAIKQVRGPMVSGFTDMGRIMGDQMALVMDHFGRFGSSGALESSFDNVNEGIRRASQGVAGFASAYLSLLEGGSKLMPRFGGWITNLGKQFAHWADQANKSGAIGKWVDAAVESVQNLGRVGLSVAEIVGGIGVAADRAGLNGLEEFADGVESVATSINSIKGQNALTQLFEDSGDAIGNMGPGFRTLMTTISAGLEGFGEGMEISGDIISNFMRNISTFLRTGGGQAFLDILSGMDSLMGDIQPGAESLGEIIGDLGRIGEELLINMGPGINNLLETIEIFIDGIADGVIAAMPVFNDFVQALMQMVKAVIGPLADGIGGLLSLFAALPGPMQTAAMTIGLLAAGFVALARAMPGITNFVRTFRADMKALPVTAAKARTEVVSFFGGTAKEAEKTAESVKKSTQAIQTSMSPIIAPRGSAGGARDRSSFTTMADAAKRSTIVISGEADKIKRQIDSIGKTSKELVLRKDSGFVAGAAGATFFASLSDEAKRAERDVNNSAKNIQRSISLIGAGDARRDPVTTSFTTLGRGSVDSIRDAEKDAKYSADSIARAIKAQEPQVAGAAKGLAASVKSGFSSAMSSVGTGLSILGGWPGLIIMGLATVGTMIAGQIADEKAKIEAEAAALEEAVNNIQPTLGKAISMDGTNFGPISDSDTFSAIRDSLTQSDGFESAANKIGLDMDNFAVALGSNIPTMQRHVADFGEIGKQLKAAEISFNNTNLSPNANGVIGDIANDLGWNAMINTMPEDLREAVDKSSALGKELEENFRDMDLAGAGEKILAAREGMAEGLEGMGVDIAQFKDLSMNEINSLVDGYDRIVNAVSDAKKQVSASNEEITASNKAMSEFDIATSMAENWGNLTSTLTSVEQKFAAFKSNLKLQGEDFLGQMDLKFDMAQLEQQMSTQFDGFYQSLSDQFSGTKVKDLFKQVKDPVSMKDIIEFDFDSANKDIANASQQLYQTLRPFAEGVQKAFITEYDSALSAMGDPKRALDSAKALVDPLRDSLEQELRNLGIKDQGVLDSFMTTLGISDEQLELGISLDGEAAISQAIEVQNVMDALASGDWRMILRAESDEVKIAVAQAMDLGGSYTDQEFTAQLHLMAEQANMDFTSFAGRLASMDGDKAEYILSVRDQGLDEVMGRMQELKTVTGKENVAKVRTQIVGSADNIWETLDKLDGLGNKDIKYVVNAMLKGEDIDTVLAELAKKETTTGVNAEVKNLPEVGEAITQAGEGAKIEVKPEIIPPENLANGQLFAGLASSGAGAGGATVNITTNVEMGQVEHLRGVLSHYQNTTVNVVANVQMGGVEHLRGVLAAYQNTTVNVSAAVQMGGVEHLRGVLASMSNKVVNVTAAVQMGGVEHLRGVLSSMSNKVVNVSAAVQMGGVEHLRGVLASMGDKTVTISANNSPANGAINHIRGAMASLPDKTVTIRGQNDPANGAINHIRGALASLPDKTVTIRGNNSHAMNAIRAVNAARVQDKTQTITTVRRTIGAELNGGMYLNNVKTFANGGINKKILQSLRSHAGSSENHVAQIARGGYPYRVWAEPETGGEAYIPLGLSKRKRSMQILEQVARHFGLALEQYSDGGFHGTSHGGGITSFANGGIQTFATGGTTKRTAAQKEQANITKEMLESLRDIFKEAAKDLRGVFREIQDTPLQSEIGRMTDQLSDFYSEYRKSRPAQARNAGRVRASLDNQLDYSNVWARRVGGRNVSQLEDARYMARDALQRQSSRRMIDWNPKRTLRDYELALTKITDELEKQQGIYDNMEAARKSMSSSIQDGLYGSFDLGSQLSQSDEFGYRPPTTASQVGAYAKKMMTDMKSFSSKLEALRKAGYNNAIVAQIAGMKLEDGIAVANALLTDKSFKNSINASFKTMFGANGDMNFGSEGGTYVGGLAGKIGSSMSKAMFGAGLNAQQGLVNGLTKDKTAIEKAAIAMSNALVASFKKAMKIKSPSRVMFGLGQFIPQGLALGIEDEAPLVAKTMASLIKPSALNLTPGRSSAGYNAASGIMDNNNVNPAGITINQTINPAPGMDEVLVGKAASRELAWKLDER